LVESRGWWYVLNEPRMLGCLDASKVASILISWGDDPYLYTIKMTKIEITNINGNTKTFYQFLIRKQVLVSIT
jgi:hypothetical protein